MPASVHLMLLTYDRRVFVSQLRKSPRHFAQGTAVQKTILSCILLRNLSEGCKPPIFLKLWIVNRPDQPASLQPASCQQVSEQLSSQSQAADGDPLRSATGVKQPSSVVGGQGALLLQEHFLPLFKLLLGFTIRSI